jgi:uncharacterized DUF497 family protein
MEIEYDPQKNARNIAERGLSFDTVTRFDFETALFSVDVRHDYGETRYRALGLIDSRLHALVFVETTYGIRVISLRKANRREVRRYDQATRS